MKFAKLFDVADTQVLFEVKADSEGDPALHVSTCIAGSLVVTTYTMDGKTEDEGWDLAYRNLERADQEAADEVYEASRERLLDRIGKEQEAANT